MSLPRVEPVRVGAPGVAGCGASVAGWASRAPGAARWHGSMSYLATPSANASGLRLARFKQKYSRSHTGQIAKIPFVILSAAKNPSGCPPAIVALDFSLRSE